MACFGTLLRSVYIDSSGDGDHEPSNKVFHSLLAAFELMAKEDVLPPLPVLPMIGQAQAFDEKMGMGLNLTTDVGLAFCRELIVIALAFVETRDMEWQANLSRELTDRTRVISYALAKCKDQRTPLSTRETVMPDDCAAVSRGLAVSIHAKQGLAITAVDVDAYSSQPLQHLAKRFVRDGPAEDGRTITFDTTVLDAQAKNSRVAAAALARLQKDIAEYNEDAKLSTPRSQLLEFLRDFETTADDATYGTIHCNARKHTKKLVSDIEGEVLVELATVQAGMASLLYEMHDGGDDTVEQNQTSLRIAARISPSLCFEDLLLALLSKDCEGALRTVNPGLGPDSSVRMSSILSGTSAVMFRAIKLSQLHMCLGSAIALLTTLDTNIVTRMTPREMEAGEHVFMNIAVRQCLEQASYDYTQADTALKGILASFRKIVTAPDEQHPPAGTAPERDAGEEVTQKQRVLVAFVTSRFDAPRANKLLSNSTGAELQELIDFSLRGCARTDVCTLLPDLRQDLQSVSSASPPSRDATNAVLQSAAGSLCGALTAKRAFMMSAARQEIDTLYQQHNPEKLGDVDGLAAKYGEEKLLTMVRKEYKVTGPTLRDPGWIYDPRLAVFEFSSPFMLRKCQAQLVKDFIESASAGMSSVRQMIMGAGKTTVIAPLLALVLPDDTKETGNKAKRLTIQIVPDALLAQSRVVMWEAFSSVVLKRILSFEFERGVTAKDHEGIEGIVEKLQVARVDRGVLVATPGAVKALTLHYVLT